MSSDVTRVAFEFLGVTEVCVSSFTTRLKIELINAQLTSILLVTVHSVSVLLEFLMRKLYA